MGDSLSYFNLPLVLLTAPTLFNHTGNDSLRYPLNLRTIYYTSNANMADHSVGARDESHEREASQALMFCFDNAFPEKSCLVVDLVPFVSPSLRVSVFLNTTARE